jgi:hypothetical protein
MSVYGPTSIMHNRFDQITEWRCSGDTWGEVRFKLGLSRTGTPTTRQQLRPVTRYRRTATAIAPS